jgi:hypothetical protein
MTAVDHGARHGGLDAVRRLETALEDRDDASGAADAALHAARAQAERLLADARAAGTDAGLRRRAVILADAEAEASAIRAAGETAAEDILERVSVVRDELVAELAAVLLPAER